MTDQMARLQQEAEERYNRRRMTVGSVTDQLKSAFIAGRTVTVEQVEEGARASYAATGSPLCWEVAGKPAKQEHRKRVRAAFRAAGLVIEE